MTIRAGIYARQSEDVAEGIARQLTRGRKLASARDYEVVGEYPDNDTSAYKSRAVGTAWAAMLADIHAGRIDVVIAVDLDRLLRDPRDLATLIDAGARILTVDGEIDLMTADGEFRASMLASLARFEVRRKSERQLRANEARVAAGRPVPGRRRYGYESDGVTPRESEAAVVRRMFAHVAEGKSLRSLARQLQADGVDPAPGRSWSTGRVRYILTNPAYGGALGRAGSEVDSQIVPVVDADLAGEVRAILADDARRTTPGPTPRYLASGLVACGVCAGTAEHGRDEHGSTVGLLYNLAHAYRCKADATHPTIKRELLDDRLRHEVALAFLALGGDVDDESKDTALAPLLRELNRIERAQRATAADRDEGLLPAPVARERLLELRDEHASVDAKIEAVRVQRSASSSVADVAREVLAAAESTKASFASMHEAVAAQFAALDIDRQRAIVRDFLDVTLHPGRDPRRVVVWHKVATALNPDEDLLESAE